MDLINDYLNLETTYKYNYIKNNDKIKTCDPPIESLLSCIYSDADIILKALNISPGKYGYNYWRDAIFLFISADKLQISVCNHIYPAIAKKYNKSAISVEKAMRLCFENSMHDSEKKKSNFIYSYMKSYLLNPRNRELLVKISELISSKEFQQQKTCNF